MRAREIEKWLAKVLHDGATELVDAEIAKHIIEVWRRHIEREASFGPHDHREAAVTLPILRARALDIEKQRLKRGEQPGDAEYRALAEKHTAALKASLRASVSEARARALSEPADASGSSPTFP